MRKALLILTTLIFSGCMSIYLPPPSLKPGEVITKQYISITVPENPTYKWTMPDSANIWIIIGLEYPFATRVKRARGHEIIFGSYDIKISESTNASFEDIKQFTREEIREFTNQRNNYIVRRYYTYVFNVKCIAEIDNWFRYSIRCPYYNTKGDINAITVEAGTSAPINLKSRASFKPDLESMINSIKIHDMDIARMKKENRWFDKKFSIDDENHFVTEWRSNHDEFLRFQGLVDEDWLK